MTDEFLTPFHELMNYTDDLEDCADGVLDFKDSFKKGKYDLERLSNIAEDIKKNVKRIRNLNHKYLNIKGIKNSN